MIKRIREYFLRKRIEKLENSMGFLRIEILIGVNRRIEIIETILELTRVGEKKVFYAGKLEAYKEVKEIIDRIGHQYK